jgi:hypothetical protein
MRQPPRNRPSKHEEKTEDLSIAKHMLRQFHNCELTIQPSDIHYMNDGYIDEFQKYLADTLYIDQTEKIFLSPEEYCQHIQCIQIMKDISSCSKYMNSEFVDVMDLLILLGNLYVLTNKLYKFLRERSQFVYDNYKSEKYLNLLRKCEPVNFTVIKQILIEYVKTISDVESLPLDVQQNLKFLTTHDALENITNTSKIYNKHILMKREGTSDLDIIYGNIMYFNHDLPSLVPYTVYILIHILCLYEISKLERIHDMVLSVSPNPKRNLLDLFNLENWKL